MDAQLSVRDACDSDAEALIGLIGSVFAEYPNCILDVDGELPELRTIATTFAAWGGRFWVATRGDVIVGCAGHSPAVSVDGIELRKLYVARSARRTGLGTRLCDLVESEARSAGRRYVELWTDTRFLDAHRLYARRGYQRGPETRALHDKSDSIEFYYRKEL